MERPSKCRNQGTTSNHVIRVELLSLTFERAFAAGGWSNVKLAPLGAATYADGALTRSTKELIALALSIASRCDGCVAYHARRLSELGTDGRQVVEAVGIALQMGGGPSMVYGGAALRAFDSFAAPAVAA